LRVAPPPARTLGRGFDNASGLALGLHDVVEARVTGSGLDIEGCPAKEWKTSRDLGEKHLIARAMRVAFDDLNLAQPPGLALRCVKPDTARARPRLVGRPAIVAGVLAASRAPRWRERRPGGTCCRSPSVLEGHPDNVAPCLFGGLTIAWFVTGAAGLPEAARPSNLTRFPRCSLSRSSRRCRCPPRVARGLLPAAVPHADAARNAGRAALLIAALTARPDALLEGTEDKLHQDYRATAMAAHARSRRPVARRGRARGRLRRGGRPSLAFPNGKPDTG